MSTIVPSPDERLRASGYKCKVEGCEEPVLMHKGATAGWCTKIQDNGKTHRQERVEELRNRPHGLTPTKPKEAAKPQSDSGGWLVDVREQILEAVDQVAIAEQELEASRQKLRTILASAQEALGG